MEIVRLGCGLHACDVRDNLKSSNPKVLNYSLVQTVDQNKDMFYTMKIQRDNQVRKLRMKIVRSGLQSFNTMLDETKLSTVRMLLETPKWLMLCMEKNHIPSEYEK